MSDTLRRKFRTRCHSDTDENLDAHLLPQLGTQVLLRSATTLFSNPNTLQSLHTTISSKLGINLETRRRNVESYQPTTSSGGNIKITLPREFVPAAVAPIVSRRDSANGATRLEGTGIHYFENNLISYAGPMSVVYNGYYGAPDRPAAVKRLFSSPDNIKLFENELNVWLSIAKNSSRETPYIIQLYDYAPWNKGGGLATNYYFAMELASSDLHTRIQKFASSSPNEESQERLKGYLRDAACGLKWLHCRKHPILHRDIKPQNILIFRCPEDRTKEIAKLGDFGIRRNLGFSAVEMGVTEWMSPEAIEAIYKRIEIQSTMSMEIFSFGVTCHYTMSFGQHPFRIKETSISENIRSPDLPPGILKHGRLIAANDLFGWMMDKNLNRRPGIEQVLHHIFWYSWKQSLNFLLDVATFFLNDPSGGKETGVREAVEDEFKKTYLERRNVDKVDWKQDFGKDVVDLFLMNTEVNSDSGKGYNHESVIGILELIKDMYIYYTEAHYENGDEKNNDNFGNISEYEEWIFSEKKFVLHFLKTVPELLPVLFRVMIKQDEPLVRELKYTKTQSTQF